jgi:hypothetical protein
MLLTRFIQAVEQDCGREAPQMDFRPDGILESINGSDINHSTGGLGQTATAPNSFYEVPGSHSTSTRPEMPTPSQSTQLKIRPAPIFSFVADAATGGDIVSGNRTLDMSPVGSEEVAARKRHYEGCMLCSPLPTPSSSISSYVPEFSPSNPQDSGPPPDMPLPELRSQLGIGSSSTANDTNPMKRHQVIMFEGEVSPTLHTQKSVRNLPFKPTSPVPSPEMLGDPGPASVALNGGQPLYPHRGSLSTLVEGDEESHFAHSRAHQLGVRRSVEAASNIGRSAEYSRPQTSERDPYNLSQDSLLQPDSNTPAISPTPSHTSRIGIKRKSSGFKTGRSPSSQDTGSPYGGNLIGKFLRSSATNEGKSIEMANLSPSTLENRRKYPVARIQRDERDEEFVNILLSGPSDSPGENINVDPNRKKPGLGRAGYYYACGATIGIILLVVILLLIRFVDAPKSAQKDINNADFNITRLTISEVGPQSARLILKMDVGLPSKSNNSLDLYDLQLYLDGTNDDSMANVKRSDSKIRMLADVLYWPEQARQADGVLGVTMVGNHLDRINFVDWTAWSSLIKMILSREIVTNVRLTGKFDIDRGLLRSAKNLSLEKALVLEG